MHSNAFTVNKDAQSGDERTHSYSSFLGNILGNDYGNEYSVVVVPSFILQFRRIHNTFEKF